MVSNLVVIDTYAFRRPAGDARSRHPLVLPISTSVSWSNPDRSGMILICESTSSLMLLFHASGFGSHSTLLGHPSNQRVHEENCPE